MKVAIAVFAALIIGSNASILGNMANAATITNQANGLANSFVTQVTGVATNAVNDVKQQLQTVEGSLQGALNEVQTIAQNANAQVQLTASDATEIAVQVAKAIATLASNAADTIAKATAAVSTLPGQLTVAAGKNIVTLNSKILSGALPPKCFTNEIPAINGKIAIVVNNTESGLQGAVNQTFQTVSADVLSVQTILSTINSAVQSGSITSVSLQSSILCFDVTFSFFD